MNEDCREDLRRMKKKTQRATEVQFVYEIYLCDVCACWEIGADGAAHLTLSTFNDKCAPSVFIQAADKVPTQTQNWNPSKKHTHMKHKKKWNKQTSAWAVSILFDDKTERLNLIKLYVQCANLSVCFKCFECVKDFLVCFINIKIHYVVWEMWVTKRSWKRFLFVQITC